MKSCFDSWKIIGIAVSGDLGVEYQNKFNCYTIDLKQEKIVPFNQVTNFISKEQFLALFNSLNKESAIATVSSSSKKINDLLRSVDSQKRPVLLSVLMICLHKVKENSGGYKNDFPNHYKTYQPSTIITNVLDTVNKVLIIEGMPQEKFNTLSTELAFLTTDQTLNNSEILKEILKELETFVIPLFDNFATTSNYDIIGKFYEEFLKYAGVSAVPDSARVVQIEGLKTDKNNHLLMHAMAPNVSGVIGSAVAAGILLSFLK